MTNAKRFAPAALLLAVLTVAPALGQARTGAGSAQETTIGGVTQPIRSIYSRPNLPQPGVIFDVKIKPGDHVKKGDLLIQQDDRLEVVKLKAAELEAKSTARIDEAKANLEVKKSVMSRKEKLHQQNALSAQEYEEAKLEVIDAEARLKISELEQQKAAAEAEGQKVKITQMKLVAPFDGVVQSVEIGVGEVNDLQKPVCSIVQITPLWVEIRNMPASWAGKLKVGDKLDVRYDERYAGTPIYDQQWTLAVLEFKDPVVNAQSDTQLVRLRMDNARGLEAGLHVNVRLPQGIAPVEPAGTAAAP